MWLKSKVILFSLIFTLVEQFTRNLNRNESPYWWQMHVSWSTNKQQPIWTKEKQFYIRKQPSFDKCHYSTFCCCSAAEVHSYHHSKAVSDCHLWLNLSLSIRQLSINRFCYLQTTLSLTISGNSILAVSGHCGVTDPLGWVETKGAWRRLRDQP